MFNVDAIVANLEAAGFTVIIGHDTTEKTLLKAIYIPTGHTFDIILDHINKVYEASGDQSVDLVNKPEDMERFQIMDKISRAIWGF
jgi:hypothetical protein